MVESGAVNSGRPRVVAVCLVPARRQVAINCLAEVVAAGGSGLLITADGSTSQSLPPGVEHLDLASTEQVVGAHQALARSPVRVARRLLGKPSTGPTRAWRAWSSSRPYRGLRPWVLWRALRKKIDQVKVDQVDHVIIVSIESWPMTWQLIQLNPRITYGWSVPAEVYERVGKTAAL